MEISDDNEMHGMMNNTIAQQFLNNGIIDEKINKLFMGERSNIKHKSFKKQLAIQLRQAKLIDNMRKNPRLKS
jgi:hypothetical protein